ncbi:MAG TPA: peptidase M1, partial [Alteromonas sp.]|nr:peptidase M1 [Alteromonas sp.]
LVNELTGEDFSWFFDVYLYQPKLPELYQQRTNDTLTLNWLVPDDLPFPMPVEVSVNGKLTILQLPAENTIKVSEQDVVIVDPNSKLLRFEARYDAAAK